MNNTAPESQSSSITKAFLKNGSLLTLTKFDSVLWSVIQGAKRDKKDDNHCGFVDNVKWQKNFHDRGRERMSFLVFPTATSQFQFKQPFLQAMQAVSLQGCPFRTCCRLVIDCWQRQRQGGWRDPCTSTWLAKHCLQILHKWYTILAYYLDNRLLFWNYNCKFLSLIFTFRSQYIQTTHC